MANKKHVAHSNDACFEESVKELLLFRKIVKVEKLDEQDGILTLDNGTQLIVQGNCGCGGCDNGWYYLYELNKCDNVITNVKCELNTEGYDDVYARRKTRDGETFLKKFTSKMYYRVLQKLTNIQIQKDTGDFRLLDRRCVNALKKLRESQRCSKSMFSWIGYKKKEVLFDREPRVAGKTKWNYKKLIDLAIDGITSFTTSPLRLSTYLTIPTFITLAVYFIYVIVKSCTIHEPIQAFQAIILINLFFFGIIILLIGIIGEYLGRIFNETKNRPLYFVDDYNGEKEQNE